jgi:hypothetical protein
MRKATGSVEPTTSAAADGKESSHGSGAPLPGDVRVRMEPQLGADLSDVKVHTDARAARTADQLGARAFTVGADVHFNAGEYAPGSKQGDRLLAHELTHVVQGQRSGIQRKANESAEGHDQADASPAVSQPNEPAEQEADAVGDRVAEGLHGDGARKGAAPHDANDSGATEKPPQQNAPPIAAKLKPGTVSMAGRKSGATAAAAPPAPAAGGATVDLATACNKDPVAKQKYIDVTGEAQPRAAAMRTQFLDGATKRLQKMPDKPLQAMRDEVTQTGTKYLLLGNKVPENEILKRGGVSRVLDLPSLFNHGYLSPAFLSQWKVRDPDGVVQAAIQKHFDPNRDLDESAVLRGKTEETWWFPSSEANAVKLEPLINQLYVHDQPDYHKGVVRLDMSSGELTANGLELFKPTAFDGMAQGWGTNPWWQKSADPHWGLTKNNTREAVMKATKIGAFKKRSLVLPEGVSAAASTSTPAAGAGAAKPTGGAGTKGGKKA